MRKPASKKLCWNTAHQGGAMETQKKECKLWLAMHGAVIGQITIIVDGDAKLLFPPEVYGVQWKTRGKYGPMTWIADKTLTVSDVLRHGRDDDDAQFIADKGSQVLIRAGKEYQRVLPNHRVLTRQGEQLYPK